MPRITITSGEDLATSDGTDFDVEVTDIPEGLTGPDILESVCFILLQQRRPEWLARRYRSNPPGVQVKNIEGTNPLPDVAWWEIDLRLVNGDEILSKREIQPDEFLDNCLDPEWIIAETAKMSYRAIQHKRETGFPYDACMPIGCDNGIHRPGCPYAEVDRDPVEGYDFGVGEAR
jgi:hypothetical protein